MRGKRRFRLHGGKSTAAHERRKGFTGSDAQTEGWLAILAFPVMPRIKVGYRATAKWPPAEWKTRGMRMSESWNEHPMRDVRTRQPKLLEWWCARSVRSFSEGGPYGSDPVL